MAEARYVVRPLKQDGTRGVRLEIDEFMADNAVVNLFLLALRSLQLNSLRRIGDRPDWLTYWSMGGEHGYPMEAWDGFLNNLNFGYCNHGTDTFPTWHRPYMMQFEQTLADEMARIANLYQGEEDKAKYSSAAARFRLPYWDPIMPRNPADPSQPPENVWGLPQILSAENVFVRTPDAPQDFTTIPNPLFKFTYPTDTEFDSDDQAHPNDKRLRLNLDSSYNAIETRRTPNNSGQTDNAFLDQVIKSQASELATKLWQILNPDLVEKGARTGAQIFVNRERSWNSFANHSFVRDVIHGDRYATVSVESWHDDVHGLIGTGTGDFAGVMGDPRFAAFEPMFWLHHSNVDRLLSLYQALYNKNVEGADLHKQLYPFMKNENRECFTSADDVIKEYWAPAFAVPGTQSIDKVYDLVKQYLIDTYYWATNKATIQNVLPNWPKDMSGSEALHGSDAKQQVAPPVIEMTALAPQAGLVRKSVPILKATKQAPTKQPPGGEPAARQEAVPVEQSLKLTKQIDNVVPSGAILTPGTAPLPQYQTWNANIKVRKYAFNQTFTIHLFIGWVKDEQPERFMTKKNEVGFSSIFASPAEGNKCANCKEAREADLIYEDVVPLTTSLTDYLDSNPKSAGLIAQGNIKTISSLEPEQVVPFLKEHLRWRMVDLRSNIFVGQEQQAGLEITVTSRSYTPPNADDLLGVYGPIVSYEDITRDKPGGKSYVYP